ncbi:DUF6507 family protein, partial [Streptomyces sp. NPDC005786]|uniref:DUF6507 family protein n=1 Tax=Streptomyces sp. NPDC005786 TaxID=3154891 RepID=UPI0033C147E0
MARVRRGVQESFLQNGGTGGVVSKWDIKPDGVRGVLSKTAEAAGEFEAEFTSYGDGLVG